MLEIKILINYNKDKTNMICKNLLMRNLNVFTRCATFVNISCIRYTVFELSREFLVCVDLSMFIIVVNIFDIV